MLTRIILDACVIRHTVHNDPQQIDVEGLTKNLWQYRISIADPAIGELVNQLAKGRIPFNDWSSRIHIIDSILDRKWPIFAGAKDLSSIARLFQDLKDTSENSTKMARRLWRILCDSPSIEAITKQLPSGKFPGDISEILQDSRTEWIKFVKKATEDLPKGAALKDVKRYCLEKLGSRPEDGPSLAKRIDAYITVQATFLRDSLLKKNPYKFESESNRGDSFDLSLLLYMSLPVIVVTADCNIVNRVREIKYMNPLPILALGEFNERIQKGTLEEVLKPFRNREEQVEQWRQRAYEKWISRGRPLNDDWKDWFETEPLF
jgi:hypothetical protein